LAQWYRRKYKRPEVSKAGSSTDNPFSAVLAGSIDKAPRKLTPFHQYLKVHYHTRIKEEYTRRYAIAKKKYDEATEEERENKDVEKPIPLQMRNEIGREFWNLETDEFREAVAQDAEDAHTKEVEEWEELKVVPKTPQQFHQ
jgi:hypothetical protein